jgi:very-short-patch-repair endonuclease
MLLLLSEAPGVPKGWLDQSVVERLRQDSTDQQALQRERTELLAQLSEYFGGQRPPISFPELTFVFDAALDGRETLRVLLGELWSTRFVSECDAITSAASTLPTVTDNLIGATATVAAAIQVSAPEVRSALKTLTREAEQIYRLAPVPLCWVDLQSVSTLNDRWIDATGTADAALDAQDPRSGVALIAFRARNGRDLVHALTAAEKPLLSEYSEELVPSVSHEMLVRFRTDHHSFFNRLGGQYRSDQRLLKGTRKSAKKLSLDEATSIVEAALNVQTLRAKWATLSNLLPSWLGPRFLGLDTDWAAAEADLAGLDTLLRDRDLNSNLAKCLSDVDTAKALHNSAEQVTAALSELEVQERTLLGEGRLPTNTDRIDSVRPLSDAALTSLSQLGAVFARLRPHLARALQTVEDMARLLAIGTRLEGIERVEAERADGLNAEFGDRYAGFNTDWGRVLSALAWTSKCLDFAGAPISAELEQHAEQPAPAQQYREWERDIERAAAKFEEAMGTIDAKFLVAKTDWLTWADAPWEDLSAWLLRVASESEHAADWLNYRSLAADFEHIAGTGVLDTMRKVTDTASLIPAVTERRYVTAWLESTYESEPALSRFASKDQSEVIKDFQRLDDRRPVAAQREIRGRAFSRYPEKFVTQAAAGQLGALRDQLSRKRGQLPVRKLVTRIPTLLQALKPCFMMSPLAVSQFLPKGAEASETLHFDAVIFDEASQVFPEDAVPAIDRAAQVIVVGDERQLPPTSFFRRNMDGDDDASNEDDTDDADALKGRDSILEVMNGMLGKGVAERYLDVHYRSRHENLIRFSNHYFYRNRLLVFPSPVTDHADLGLRPVYLPDARYDAGAGRTRTNRGEAEEVVRLVLEHMRTRPLDESIGVVTLSRAQADLIESLIAETRVLERDLDERFREDRREPFFVKNLENVQGDERDHIILSIGYGPTVGSGAVPNRFGPLNAEGGERRLNVAVSRARQSMTTVYSLRSTDIVSEQPGAKLLKRYIEFIENPTGAFEAEQTIDPSAEAESPFEDAVIDALRARGHRVQPQVGVAGFRIDLGILSPDGKRFDLGVECDGWTYHSSPAARDRDWLRQSILEGLGWRIHRVWSTAWIRNADEQIREIEEALELARVPSVAGGSRLIVRPLEPNARVAAPAPPQTLPAQSKPGWIFAPYQRSSLRGLRRGEELQYATSAELEPMLLRIAEVEGPVHVEVAIERIREHYGMARARQASRDRVRRAVEELGKKNSLVLERERGGARRGVPQSPPELFFSLPGCEPAPRRPDDGALGRRLIGQIPRAEIERGLELVTRALYGATSEDLLRETARQFWYDRTGPDISARINLCIKAMMKDRRLIETFGMLTAPERE